MDTKIDELLTLHSALHNFPRINDLIQEVMKAYSLPETGFYTPDGKLLSTDSKKWLTLRDPNNPWKINGIEVKVRVFGPPIKFTFDGKEGLSCMLDIELPNELNIEDALKSKDYKSIEVNISHAITYQLNPGGINKYVAIATVQNPNLPNHILVPYISYSPQTQELG